MTTDHLKLHHIWPLPYEFIHKPKEKVAKALHADEMINHLVGMILDLSLRTE